MKTQQIPMIYFLPKEASNSICSENEQKIRSYVHVQNLKRLMISLSSVFVVEI